MNSDIAISVRDLGKSYTLSHRNRPTYLTLRESLVGGLKGLLAGGRAERDSKETFWALQNISFDVERGKVMGVIGRNGAGKSTLLKILSRITDPSQGHATVRGRVGSLLEVGTGFHPELTGRENVYLNGTLLGMRKRQIDKVFDEIVAFAEVERFLDTPVKRYSSGMYVRLAFGVAAHLEPDILIIDEVLAVGDAQFQKKCLGKMKDVTGQGRTVLFVSHNLTTVNSLCDRCVLLNKGRVEIEGPTEAVTKSYFGAGEEGAGSSIEFLADEERPGDEIAKLRCAHLVNAEKARVGFARTDEAVGIAMTFEITAPRTRLVPYVHLFSQGQCIFISCPQAPCPDAEGDHTAVMWIPKRFLNEGFYQVSLVLATMDPMKVHFQVHDRLYFHVVDDIQDSSRHGYVHAIPGLIRPALDWEVN